MNYNQVYKQYFEKLLTCRDSNQPSIMFPPNFNGDYDEQTVLKVLPNDTATVIFTTGTTGEPKGVIHTRDSIDNAIESNTKLLDISKDDVLMNFLPTWTIGTYIYTVPTYLKGGKIIHDKFTPEGFKEYLNQKPTITLLIPTMLDMMKDSGIEYDLSCVRNVGVGAEQVDKRHLEYVLDLGAKSVTHMYGSSEAIPLSLYNTFYNKEDITLGLKEVDTFKYDNKNSLFISGISVSKSYIGDNFGEWYDSKDNFIIENGLYYWQKRTDNIVKKKGWKAVVEK